MASRMSKNTWRNARDLQRLEKIVERLSDDHTKITEGDEEAIAAELKHHIQAKCHHKEPFGTER